MWMPDTLTIAEVAWRCGAIMLEQIYRGAGPVVHHKCTGYAEPSLTTSPAAALDFP